VIQDDPVLVVMGAQLAQLRQVAFVGQQVQHIVALLQPAHALVELRQGQQQFGVVVFLHGMAQPQQLAATPLLHAFGQVGEAMSSQPMMPAMRGRVAPSPAGKPSRRGLDGPAP
jgi:hypothetical protein